MDEDQRVEIENVLEQLKELVNEGTPEQREAFIKIKGIVGITFDFVDNIRVNPQLAFEKVCNDLEELKTKGAIQRQPNFPKGGIVAGEGHLNEAVINRKA